MKFINRKQVCEELRISIDTFQAWVEGGLPEYRIGRIILVKQQELDSFIEVHSTTAVDGRIAAMMETM